jgi:putative phage-type endonuclease
MNQTEWLQWRKGGLGGSDAAIILKKFPFGKTPLMLYREKISQTDEIYENLATKHGKENESRALDWFEKKMGCALFRQVRAQNKEIPYIRATLDGIDLDEKYMVEMKCPFNLENHDMVKKIKKVPDIYYPQCQHQLKAKEIDGMYFTSFNSQDPEDSIILEVPRDDKFISEMLPEYEKFWHCVQNRIPPEATEFDFFCKEDPEWEEAAKKWIEAKQWAENAEKWRQVLISLSEGRNTQGCGVRVTHSECDGHIDYEAIPELIGVNKEAYRKPNYTKASVRFAKS